MLLLGRVQFLYSPFFMKKSGESSSIKKEITIFALRKVTNNNH